jgi:nicotinate phosphoribosyltransferase
MSSKNDYATALLTDQYELTMAYAYHIGGRHTQPAVFDLFFRKNPFEGEFTLYAGLAAVIEFLESFSFSQGDVNYICSSIPQCNPAFRKWLRELDCSELTVYAFQEGDVVFPRLPLMRVEGPLGLCQILESALLNLTSYPCLVATNAARMKLALDDNERLIEFGLRRAQGPDGAMSASRYSYLGGADGSSNMLAGKEYDIPVSGTQAHSFISSYADPDELRSRSLKMKEGDEADFVEAVLNYRGELNYNDTNDGELAAFIAYAQAFPDGFLALVDTYDTLRSGVPNFLCVASALHDFGYDPVGIRLDSGDLAYLSRVSREMFADVGRRYNRDFAGFTIVASNEINEATLRSLKEQGHEVDVFGVGTHLVTCQRQPSLGCVYKLVQIGEEPRIKISQETSKTTIPGRKNVYRLIGKQGYPLLDLMTLADEPAPIPGDRILCHHPYEKSVSTYVTPTKVIPLLHRVWDGKSTGVAAALEVSREFAVGQLRSIRPDHLRMINPTPYKVSLSSELHRTMYRLREEMAPAGEMH